jgi:hypothetical protein
MSPSLFLPGRWIRIVCLALDHLHKPVCCDLNRPSSLKSDGRNLFPSQTRYRRIRSHRVSVPRISPV